MSTTLRAAQRSLRGGDPLDLCHVTDLMQEGIDASVVEQDSEREELSGFHVIDERDFGKAYSENEAFQQALTYRDAAERLRS